MIVYDLDDLSRSHVISDAELMDKELRYALSFIPEGCDCNPAMHRTPTIIGGWYWDHEQRCSYAQKVISGKA